MNSRQAVEVFFNSQNILTFLREDFKGSGEVGCLMDFEGVMYNISVGSVSGVSMDVPDGQDGHFIGVHTHPSVSGTDISDRDIKTTNYPNIQSSIILSQRMFETVWDGVCFKSDGFEITDRTSFVIECEGSTDGSAEERYISNPSVVYD